MSYCRWSDDDYQCDLYSFQDVQGGWTTHVAGMRYEIWGPLPAFVSPLENTAAWLERYRVVSAIVEASELQPIKLPYAGDSFNDNTLEDFLSRLEELRRIGYRVPDYVFDDVRQEIAEQEGAL